jgi:DNA-binding SARP family transcriptional activator
LGLPVLLLLAGGAGWLWLAPGLAPGDKSAVIDPREAYPGPLRNIHPSVRYVGSKACVDCHSELVSSYARHPMGRSLTPIAALAPMQVYDAAHHNPFEAFGRRLWVVRDGNRVTHHHAAMDGETLIYEQHHEVHYAIGSGTHGYSYVTQIDGYLFQTPISWFSHKQFWAVSPGFTLERFSGRAVATTCLLCHANRVKLVAGEIDHFEKGVFEGHAIGCERCHGPAQLHVQERKRGDPVSADGGDDSIVNPRRLPWKLRENVCEQCHLQGETRLLRRGRDWLDYRPGLSLEDFQTILVKVDSDGQSKAVSHVEEMRASICFQKSTEERKLGCISCHNPHEKPAREKRVEWYRGKCLECHKDRDCKIHLSERRRQAPGDSCISCHMKKRKAADIVHAALTDHRILRDGGSKRHDPPKARFSTWPVVSFHTDRRWPANAEDRRDLGVGLIELLQRGKIEPWRGSETIRRVLDLLQEAATRAPADTAAWQGLGEALNLAGRTEEAINALETALLQQPRNTQLLEALANLEQRRKQPQRAIEHLEQAVLVNPYSLRIRADLAALLAVGGDRTGALEQVRALLRLAPGNTVARQLWILCLLNEGKKAEARREFELLRKLRPANLADLEVWFRQRGG